LDRGLQRAGGVGAVLGLEEEVFEVQLRVYAGVDLLRVDDLQLIAARDY
jgi:hypothetical protein